MKSSIVVKTKNTLCEIKPMNGVNNGPIVDGCGKFSSVKVPAESV